MIEVKVTVGRTDIWVESAAQIKECLRVLGLVHAELLEAGFHDKSAGVGDGIYEMDPSGAGFVNYSARYASYPEMEERLADDFSSAKDDLAMQSGHWMMTLNFCAMWVELERDGETVTAKYRQGTVTLKFSDPQTEESLGQRCVSALQDV